MGRVGLFSVQVRKVNSGRPTLKLGAVSLIAFAAITVLVLLNLSQTFDAQAALAINHYYLGAPLTEFMEFVSKFGREYFWIPVLAVMLVLGNRTTKLLALELTVLFAVSAVAGETMKLIVFRSRPFENLNSIITRLPASTDSSYPSGHALIVAAGATFSLLKFKKKIAAALLTAEAAFVCYSRVYVGLHYPLDVAGSIFLAGAVVGIGLFILERCMDKPLNHAVSLTMRIFKEGKLAL